jgi:methylenetetrahydrofolate dehydrogenase (NADP+)/methenyltetrahydrofolate cyclohydrolase
LTAKPPLPGCLETVRQDVAQLHAAGVTATLAVVLVGDDPESHVYVRNKVLRADEVGIRSNTGCLPISASLSSGKSCVSYKISSE